MFTRKKKKLILIALIVTIGLYVRLKGTLSGAFAFTYDQGRDMLAVHDLVVNGKLSLIGPTTGLPGVFYGPWWYWFLVPSFILSAGSPTASVISVSLVNVLMIPLGFLLGKKLGGTAVGLLLSLLFALSPPLIASSVQLWNPNLAPFFTLLSLFLLWCLVKDRSKWSLALLGLAVGGVSEFAAAFGMFFTLAVTFSVIVMKVLGKLRFSFPALLAAVGGFLFILLPRLIFDLRHDFLMSRTLLKYLAKPKVYQMPLTLSERFVARLEQFFAIFTKTITYENAKVGILFFLAIGVLIVGLLAKKKKSELPLKFFASGLLTIIAVLYFAFVIYPDAVWEYYLIGLPTIYILVIGIAMTTIKKVQPSTFLPLAVFLLIVSTRPISLLRSFVTQSQWEGDASVFRNQQQVVDYIYQEAEKEPFSTIVYTPALLDYHYQYLFAWYGKKNYGYVPTKEERLAFYVVEPDEQEDRRRRWLKEHEGDGKVVKETVLLGGIRVQKRIRELKQ